MNVIITIIKPRLYPDDKPMEKIKRRGEPVRVVVLAHCYYDDELIKTTDASGALRNFVGTKLYKLVVGKNRKENLRLFLQRV